MAKVLLLDGMSLLFRAYHAMPKMSSKDGTPTGALYGFLRLFYNIVDREHPDYVAVCLDRKEKTFREEADSSYKANRPTPDEDMITQIVMFPKLLTDMGIPSLSQAGFEADDVIATAAKKEKENGNQVIIVTGDKDVLQALDDGIKAYINKKGMSEIDEYTPASLQEKTGMTPFQFLFFKALKGDPSDNYQGVPGIGEKTAQKIASEASSVEDVEKNPKVAQNIDAFKHSLMLASIRYDVPLSYKLADLKMQPDPEKAVTFLRTYDFRTLVPRFAKQEKTTIKKVSSSEAASFIDGPFALCWEGCLQVWNGNNVLEIDVGSGLFQKTDQALKDLQKPLLSKHEKVVTDFKELLRTVDVEDPVFDVQLAAWIDEPGRSSYSVESLITAYLDDSPPPGLAIHKIAERVRANLEEKGQIGLLIDVEQPVSRVLANMETRGIKIDREALRELSVQLEKEITEKSSQVYEMANATFNILSPKQLGDVLFQKMGLEPLKKTKTGFSTSQEVLEQLKPASPAIGLILEVRELSKLKSTYVDALPAYCDNQGRVHTTYIQTGTATGRLSSTNPNLQNIPIRSDWGGKIRRCFVTEQGKTFVSADYSQIELRLLAHLSGDEELVKAFNSGEDIHTHTARVVFGVGDVTPAQRRQAKIINFGVLYGMSAHRLSNEFGVSFKEADNFIKEYFERFSGVSKYIKEVVEQGRKRGYTETILGRRRYVPDLLSKDFQVRSAGERAAVNSPIQGSAADIIKLAMIRLEQKLEKTRSRLLLQIHDELVLECPDDEANEMDHLIKEVMENVCESRVPFTCEVHSGKNLLEAK
ncbi:MAG: DNA polymerase I [Caldisericia bacterium]|nr:DNA polymerase I [Caldisericia bacterium]